MLTKEQFVETLNDYLDAHGYARWESWDINYEWGRYQRGRSWSNEFFAKAAPMTEEQNKLAEEISNCGFYADPDGTTFRIIPAKLSEQILAALRREPATEAVLRHIEAVTKAEEVVFNAAIVADDRMRYEEAKNLRKLSDALKKVSADLSAAIREPATEAMLEMAAKECEEAYDNLKQYSAVGPDQLLLAAKRIRALKGKGASQGEGRSEEDSTEDRLKKINEIIFSVGAPLGSDEYFQIRELCTTKKL